jgi:hypothetical protein
LELYPLAEVRLWPDTVPFRINASDSPLPQASFAFSFKELIHSDVAHY